MCTITNIQDVTEHARAFSLFVLSKGEGDTNNTLSNGGTSVPQSVVCD